MTLTACSGEVCWKRHLRRDRQISGASAEEGRRKISSRRHRGNHVGPRSHHQNPRHV